VLSDSDRDRIRSEEIFRDEVRRELSANQPTSRGKRVWSLLNNPFSIWFLSTVVIGLLTFAYSAHQERLRASARLSETLQKLDTEIAGRIRGSLIALETTQQSIASHRLYSSRMGIFGVVVKALGDEFSSYPEYRTRDLGSLLIETGPMVPSQERAAVAGALAAYQELRRGSLGGVPEDPISPGNATPAQIQRQLDMLAEVRRAIEDKIWLARWRK
jgi:hypothetical protein